MKTTIFKRILAVLLMLFVFSNNSNATHLMGGEITWECIKSGPDAGKYIFNVKIYRDCQGVPLANINNKVLVVHNHLTISNIALTYIGATDISPACNTIDGPNPQLSCGGTNIGYAGSGDGAVEEHIYTSEPMIITGTPDSDGWHFTYTDIARNLAVINLANNTGQYGFTLRAVMYSYTDSLGVVYPNNNECYDSSPKFYEKPRTILEVGNGPTPFSFSNGFTYSHNAFDEEQDSIGYHFAQPLDGYNAPAYDYLNADVTNAIPFAAGFSVTTPIQGIFMYPTTGRTNYPAIQPGNYVTCTRVSAYKCGNKIASIYREIQVVLIPFTEVLGDTTNGNIGANTLRNVRPLVQPPFFYPATSAPYQWDTLVHCGDTVAFDFIATDDDVYPNGSQQDLLFEVSGGQFYDYYNSIPCQNPPCATFNEIGTGTPPPFIASGGTGSGQFEWITSCNHVINSCSGLRPSVYTFVIKVSDDFCPTPAIENTSQVISITVFPSCSNLKIPVTTINSSCLMNNGTAQVVPSGGTPPYVIYWSDLNGLPVNSNTLTAGDYIVRVTDSTFCEAVDTITVHATSVSTPSSTLSATAVSCYGSSDGNISSAQSGGQLPYTYLWSTGDTTQSISNVVAGTYTLGVYDANNCIATDSIIVTEPAALQVSIANSNGVMTGTSLGGTTPYTYEFFGPNGLVASSSNNSGNNFSITPINSGNYTFIVVDANGCSDSTSINFSITSIKEFSKFNIIIHPNPSNGKITLEMNGVNNDMYNVTINNLLGQTVYTIEKDVNDFFTEDIDISKFGKGTYLITISNSSSIITEKLIVE